MSSPFLRPLLLVPLLVAALVAACATPSPKGKTGAGRSADKGSPAAKGPASREQLLASAKKQFPNEGWIVGLGEGATADEAEQRARVDAAAQIRSEITGNLRLFEQSGSAGEHVSVSQETVQKVQSDAGALIRPVRELTRDIGGTKYAVAVVERTALDEKYAAEAARLVETLSGAWGRALGAGSAAPDQVAAALCEADPAERELDQRDLERRLVTGRSAWTPELVEKRRAVGDLRQKVKSATEVQVVRGQGAAGQEVAQAILTQLGRIGYPARVVEDPSCKDGGSVFVTVSFEESCGEAQIGGIRCEVGFAVRGSRCGRGELFNLPSEKGRAMHASNRQLAVKQATSKINVNGYTSSLADRLVAALGGGCQR